MNSRAGAGAGSQESGKENVMLEKHSAGENIAAYCTKCKASCDHIIVAMAADGEAIAKVKCRTCGSAHKYRTSADRKTGTAAKKKEEKKIEKEINYKEDFPF